jgi:heme-degrading monooxygenase HmoA
MLEDTNTTEGDREIFGPLRDDYADFAVPVPESFRWGVILDHLGVPLKKYVALYAFRSIPNPEAEEEVLLRLDESALLAAKDMAGFLHYEPLKGLSYCLWSTRAAAKIATSSAEHREAAKYVGRAYKQWELQSWDVARVALDGRMEFVKAT